MAVRVIVTRPERDALRWAAELEARGFDAPVLPLIDIRPAADQLALRRAWTSLHGCVGAMFVSGNAVEHFFASRPPGTERSDPHGTGGLFTSHAGPRAWATGPGTTQALLAAGVPAGLIDAPDGDSAQFDSEALWDIVSPRIRPGERVMIVRGSDATGDGVGRNWFAGQVEKHGGGVDFAVAYERRTPVLDARQLALARDAAGDGSVWLFSSSEAIGNLQSLLPGQSWARARAVATHPRIAQAARKAGFAVVCESRPPLDDVVASIESTA